MQLRKNPDGFLSRYLNLPCGPLIRGPFHDLCFVALCFWTPIRRHLLHGPGNFYSHKLSLRSNLCSLVSVLHDTTRLLSLFIHWHTVARPSRQHIGDWKPHCKPSSNPDSISHWRSHWKSHCKPNSKPTASRLNLPLKVPLLQAQHLPADCCGN